jgi:hypothetical protein
MLQSILTRIPDYRIDHDGDRAVPVAQIRQ